MYEHIPDEGKVCGTCEHWDTATARHMGLLMSSDLAPCKVKAVDPDAGYGALVLLGPCSHCLVHSDKWQPHKDYLAECAAKDAA